MELEPRGLDENPYSTSEHPLSPASFDLFEPPHPDL